MQVSSTQLVYAPAVWKMSFPSGRPSQYVGKLPTSSASARSRSGAWLRSCLGIGKYLFADGPQRSLWLVEGVRHFGRNLPGSVSELNSADRMPPRGPPKAAARKELERASPYPPLERAVKRRRRPVCLSQRSDRPDHPRLSRQCRRCFLQVAGITVGDIPTFCTACATGQEMRKSARRARPIESPAVSRSAGASRAIGSARPTGGAWTRRAIWVAIGLTSGHAGSDRPARGLNRHTRLAW